MRDIRIAAAQFEHRDGDKAYNLGRIRDLTRRGGGRGAEVVCFHECSVTAYTFLQTLSPRRAGRPGRAGPRRAVGPARWSRSPASRASSSWPA